MYFQSASAHFSVSRGDEGDQLNLKSAVKLPLTSLICIEEVCVISDSQHLVFGDGVEATSHMSSGFEAQIDSFCFAFPC